MNAKPKILCRLGLHRWIVRSRWDYDFKKCKHCGRVKTGLMDNLIGGSDESE